MESRKHFTGYFRSSMLLPVIGLMAENKGYLRNGMEHARSPRPGSQLASNIWLKTKVILAMEMEIPCRGRRTQLLTNGSMMNWGWRMENGNSLGDSEGTPSQWASDRWQWPEDRGQWTAARGPLILNIYTPPPKRGP